MPAASGPKKLVPRHVVGSLPEFRSGSEPGLAGMTSFPKRSAQIAHLLPKFSRTGIFFPRMWRLGEMCGLFRRHATLRDAEMRGGGETLNGLPSSFGPLPSEYEPEASARNSALGLPSEYEPEASARNSAQRILSPRLNSFRERGHPAAHSGGTSCVSQIGSSPSHSTTLKVICEKTAAAVLNRCGQVQAVTKLEAVPRPYDRGSLEDRFWQRNVQQIRAVEKSVVIGKKRSVVEPDRFDPALQASQVAGRGLVVCRGDLGQSSFRSDSKRVRSFDEVDNDHAVEEDDHPSVPRDGGVDDAWRQMVRQRSS
jgi:hypothetical protein